jgi:predicted transcriptional regulator
MTESPTPLDPGDLFRRRVVARITQAELAERAGVDQSYISLIERRQRGHRRGVDPDRAKRIVKALAELEQLKAAA